jgi:hypothetical protein
MLIHNNTHVIIIHILIQSWSRGVLLQEDSAQASDGAGAAFQETACTAGAARRRRRCVKDFSKPYKSGQGRALLY